jgi:hypothetical protein
MQCIIVKEGSRCINDSVLSGLPLNHTPGLTLPIVRTDAIGYICGDCIYDLYQALTARDLTPTSQGQTRIPDQVRKEMGLA